MNVLNFKPEDDETFKVDWDVVQTIRTMQDDPGIEEDKDGENTIPISNKEVTAFEFIKALFWMENNFQHDDDELELTQKERISLTLWLKPFPFKFRAEMFRKAFGIKRYEKKRDYY